MMTARGRVLALLLAVLAVLLSAGGNALAKPAGTPATPSDPAAASSTTPPTHRLCGTPASPGMMACLAIARDDVAVRRGLIGSAAAQDAPAGYGPADLRSAYALPEGGAGQTVAIVDAYDNPNADADLATYRQQYGLPPCTTASGCLTKVDQRGGHAYPIFDAGWAGEISLDLDMVSAACPNCRLLLVEADDPSPANLYAAEDTAIALGAKFVSNSWGGYEGPDQTTDGDPHFNHPGVAITVASGDHGYEVNYPASSQYVTAVGGTTLTRDSGSARGWAESAWRLGGSGCSPWEPKPAFQPDPACPKRTVADVSSVADPETGVAVYDGGWKVYGGTSAGAPLVAALYALAGAPLSGTAANSYPYAHPEALNDVTTGSNGNCDPSLAYFCAAGPGYDAPTGLGTPRGVAAFGAGAHAEITGTVTEAGTGKPLAGATVTAGDKTTRTDVSGHYAFTLPPGDYPVLARLFGYDPAGTRVTLTADGQVVTADLALAPGPRVTVSGLLRDASGHGWPLYGTVALTGPDAGQPGTSTHTDPATGRYSLSLPAGATYTLRATPAYPGYPALSREITAGDGDVVADFAATVAFASCEDAPGYAYHTGTLATESFDTTGPPAGWSLADLNGRGMLWRFDDPGGRTNRTGGAGNFAVADPLAFGPSLFQDTALISPTYDLTGTSHPSLSFRTDYYADYSDVALVEVSADGGASWQQVWRYSQQSRRGPDTEIVDLSAYAGQPSVQVRFRYEGWYYWWWEVDDVTISDRSCDPIPGGLVTGRVTDANTGAGVNGATVQNDDNPAERATTVSTPDDPDLGEGFYWLFSAASGAHPFTARAAGGYRSGTHAVTVAHNTASTVGYALTAGQLSVTPSLKATATLGTSKTTTLTVKNTGTAPATVTLSDVPGEVSPLLAAPGAPATTVPGTFTPGRLTAATTGAKPATAAPAAAGPWTPVANYPTPVADNTLAVGPDGQVYSVGGSSSATTVVNRLYSYNPESGAWTRHADEPVARDAPETAFLYGKLYVTGGWGTSGAIVPRTEVYDPRTDTWSTAADLPRPVAGAATAVLDGRMYVVGGCPAVDCHTRDVQVFDPATGTWGTAADYPESIAWLGCGAIAGKLYCAGGHTPTGGTRDAYVYDPTTDTWSPIAGLPGDNWAMGYSAASGRLLLSGGVVLHSAALTNAGNAYDPATDTWSPLPNANLATYRGGSACGFYRIGGAYADKNPDGAGELLPGLGQCTTADDVPWLATDRTRLTLDPGASAQVTVTLDAGAAGVTQPGTYTAGLGVSEDTPYHYQPVPVTLTVNPPATWGKIAGTVTGTPCGTTTAAPIPGATVQINGWAQSWTLKTDAAGRYALWLDTRNNPLTVIVAKDGWIPRSRQVTLTKQKTTTVDAALKPTC